MVPSAGGAKLPVISYHDVTNGRLKIAACADLACTSAQIATVDTTGASLASPDAAGATVGQYSQIRQSPLGVDVAYYNATSRDVKVLACSSATCSGTVSMPLAVTAGNVGLYTSLAVSQTSGAPFLAYYNQDAQALAVTGCSTAACSTPVTGTRDTSSLLVGFHTSTALLSDGRPVIAYQDNTSSSLKLFACANSVCSSGNAVVVDSGNVAGAGLLTSIVVAPGDLPIISYFGNNRLKLAFCANSSCSSATIRTPDTSGDTVGRYSSVALTSDGRPVVSYFDSTSFRLKLLVCGDATCTSGSTITVLDSLPGGDVGRFASLGMTDANLPVIAYYDLTNGDLKVAACGTTTCQ
jgi:hypothetical protein